MELLLAFLVEKEHILMFSKVFCLKFKRLKITKLVFQDSPSRTAWTLTLLPCLAVFQIEYARKNMNSANQKLLNAQEKLYQSWVEWKKYTGQNDGDESHSAEVNKCTCKLKINGLYTVKITLANNPQSAQHLNSTECFYTKVESK